MKCMSFFRRDLVLEDERTLAPSSTPVFSSEMNSIDTSPEIDSFRSLLQKSGTLNVKPFTLAELKTATKNFSRKTRIGEGGFGLVYKGVINKVEVAVKQLNTTGFQGHKEWVAEVNFLGIVEHQNLVKLVGYCAEDDERGIQRLLVYEYLRNGSVDDHLSVGSPSMAKVLTWDLRLKIARDAARGLAHLHEGMGFQIIFRDFKSSNILLDENWNAKLSDFGLARLGPEEGFTHVTTGVVGTLGYAAPEYMQTGHLTSKSDVWGFGVFLYELITGRRPLDVTCPGNEQNMLIWIRPYLLSLRKFKHILDPRLDWNQQSLESAYKLSSIANLCLNRHAKSRPKMGEVMGMVDEIPEPWSENSGEGKGTVEGKCKRRYQERSWFVRACREVDTV